ncbi:AfsR/SARP family transcriptional regulator [Nonomuraea aurantiaca]|uniref:AfsR/SARP family transcriptional regulator n=1 Tax=Nonomuraea aurantiaca TaxID=2878562 RepID=UPI001CDA1E0C|nr:AfsR/SARP family transcriptional regulator [Nonomuraea aurantiaca]MCA2225472.1 winged helix-turn-helix domain-containing protein [Nonomuraea aurantiaca]
MPKYPAPPDEEGRRPLRFRLLGPLRLESDPQPQPEPGPAKHRAVLAALLVSAGRVVPIERLMAVVWDERPPASAESVLRVYISALRKLVDGIRTVPGGYLIEVEPDAVDCHRFERLVGEARRAREAGRAEVAAEGFRAALALWRGDAMADIESSYLRRTHAVPLEELRLTALEERVELDLLLGRGGEVVGELRALVGAYPLRERAWARLLDALRQAGRRAEALAAYQDARRVLVEELGLEPGTELVEAHRRVLSSEGPQQRAPVMSEAPPDISDFTGRRAVLDWIVARVPAEGGGRSAEGGGAPADRMSAQGGAPVHLVLHGPPGCGKSAVAVRAATMIDLPDGRLYASLRDRQPGAVLEDLLRSLGCPDGAVPAAFEERVRLYRGMTATRSLLVVLDDATDEAQVRPLLPTGPGSLTLVTSRSPLAGLEAARAYELGVFEPGEAVAMLAEVVGRERVGAEPEAADRIVRLCGGLPLALRIAGSRLARKPGWTLDHLAGRLGDERRRLDELSAGDLAVRGSLALGYHGLADSERRLLRRLGALSAPDFASWALGADLEPLAEAGLLQSLGLDESGGERYGWHDLTRLYAAERLTAEDGGPAAVLAEIADEILDRTRHARTALLPAEPGSGRTLAHTEGQALAADQWRSRERELGPGPGWAGERGLDAGPGWVEERTLGPSSGWATERGLDARPGWAEGRGLDAGPAGTGGPGPGAAHGWALTGGWALETGRLRADARWLSAERRFLVAAVGDFHRAGLHEAAWRLAFYLTPLFELGAHHDDWHVTTATGLDAARAAGHREGEALLLRALADLHRVEGRPESAAAALRAAQPLVEGLELARIMLRLGLVERRPVEAERALVRCLHVFEEAGDRRGTADALRALGVVRGDLGLVERSLEAYEDLGDPRGAAEALLDLARLHLGGHRYARARDCAERRIRINRRLGDRLPEAAGLLVLAEIASAEGDPDAAARLASQAEVTFTAHGDRINASKALIILIKAHLDLDEVDAAVEGLARVMGESDSFGEPRSAEVELLAQELDRRRGLGI